MDIGLRIKAERERLGYNQTDFAAIGGASKNSQIAWEKGMAFPNAQVLEAWLKLGMDVVYILTGERTTITSLAPDEVVLLDNYRHSTDQGKAALRSTSAAFAQTCRVVKKKVKVKQLEAA